jgi:hypothetical protein
MIQNHKSMVFESRNRHATAPGKPGYLNVRALVSVMPASTFPLL